MARINLFTQRIEKEFVSIRGFVATIQYPDLRSFAMSTQCFICAWEYINFRPFRWPCS